TTRWPAATSSLATVLPTYPAPPVTRMVRPMAPERPRSAPEGQATAVLVMLGRILRGGDAVVPSIVVGAFMLATGVMLWRGGRAALPLIATYALYVAANLLLWAVVHPG